MKNEDNIESRYGANNEFKNFLLIKDLTIEEYLIVAKAENRYLK